MDLRALVHILTVLYHFYCIGLIWRDYFRGEKKLLEAAQETGQLIKQQLVVHAAGEGGLQLTGN